MNKTITKVWNVIKRRKNKKIESNAFECIVCGKSTNMEPLSLYYFEQMQHYGFIHNIFLTETLNILNYSCKTCGASDRDRLYALYLIDYLKNKQPVNLLDIAPAPALRSFLKSNKNVIYRSADLSMNDVDDNVDLTNMTCYKNESFDFFICSHVLEHIPDDRKAMSELFRVLKKGGQGIVMVPINLGVEKTLEDQDCTDIAGRWKYFGQDDHVRMYSKADYINRLEESGFKVSQLDQQYFGKAAFQKAALYPKSVLYIVSK